MPDALGMVEVAGLSTAVVAANIALNTADVRIQGFGYMHEGTVMVSVRGSVAAVQAAVDAVRARTGLGAVTASSVLARVDDAIEPILVKRSVRVGARAGAPKVPGRGRVYDRVDPPQPAVRAKQKVPAGEEPGIPTSDPAQSPGQVKAAKPPPDRDETTS